jgi:hypothetical protein
MHDIAPVDFVVFTISVCVVTNSEWKTINAGVPQGSILDPVLFLLFINDIVIDIKASIKLFADDTSFYVTVDTPQTAARSYSLPLGVCYYANRNGKDNKVYWRYIMHNTATHEIF